MKTTQLSGTRPVHQTVAGNIKFPSAGQSIEIGFTDQQLSPHAGTATFWAFLRQSGWIELLTRCLPQPLPQSNNALTPDSKVPGFVQGLLCGARQVTRVADLRRDPLLPALLGIKRVASQSVLSRFFQGFRSAGRKLACFRPLLAWRLERLPSRPGGCALDLDSTRLLHEDGHPEGVAVGYTRLILIRHRVKDKTGRAGGKRLFDCPGCLYQALVTNLPLTVPPLAVWREYTGHAACEG